MKKNRSQSRLDVELLVRFSDPQGIFTEECAGNISAGGIFIETLKPRAMGEVLDLFLRKPNLAQETSIRAEVVHIRTGSKDPAEKDEEGKGLTGMGLRFLITHDEEKEKLKTFLESLLSEKGSGSRKHVRIYTGKTVLVKPKDSEEFQLHVMPNLGRSGLFLETTEKVSLLEVLEIALVAPKSDKEIHLKGQVIHIRSTSEKSGPRQLGVGIRFIDLTQEKQKALDRWIHDHLTEPDA